MYTYPAAQDPEVVPPFDSHSLDVKQVPFLKRLPVPPLKERADFKETKPLILPNIPKQ